mmetsp:Transcript_60178/g.159995  ORF Transcript_60178/g.159995 Transcript_60178/m.159995 type:complete len:559 (+) Transcript_60178:590-2266(+)
MSFFFLPDLRSLIILHWQLKSLDKKLAKGESLDGCDGGVPATAEDIKKEKIAVALTYGTGNAVSSVALSSGCSGDSGANTPRSQVSLMTAPPSARSEIGGHTASINEAPPAPSPRGGAKSPVLSEGRPVRTRKATPAAAALLASAQAARERQIRGKETKETAKGSKKSVESDTETKVGRSRRALNRKEKYSQPQVQVKKTRQGRRKPAIPTPPDDDPKASDCEDPFDDTAEDGMDPAPIMDDNGGFHHISSQLDEGVSPSTRPPDAILAAAVRERLSQSRSDMAPMGNILADALGMRNKGSVLAAGAFDADMEIASALAAAVSAPRTRTAPIVIPAVHMAMAPSAVLVDLKTAPRLSSPGNLAVAPRLGSADGHEEAQFTGELIHDGGHERDLMTFFCHHDQSADAEDMVLLDARHDDSDSPNPSVDSASSVRTAPDFELSATVTCDTKPSLAASMAASCMPPTLVIPLGGLASSAGGAVITPGGGIAVPSTAPAASPPVVGATAEWTACGGDSFLAPATPEATKLATEFPAPRAAPVVVVATAPQSPGSLSQPTLPA